MGRLGCLINSVMEDEIYSYDDVVTETYELLSHPDPAIAKLARCVRSLAVELRDEETHRLEMKERDSG